MQSMPVWLLGLQSAKDDSSSPHFCHELVLQILFLPKKSNDKKTMVTNIFGVYFLRTLRDRTHGQKGTQICDIYLTVRDINLRWRVTYLR